LIPLLASLLILAAAPQLSISQTQAEKLAEKIWQNECGRSLLGLTSWNKGEEHASLGIGHFIWFPAGQKSIFQETFPALIAFLEMEGIKVPGWLKKECPWKSEEEFRSKLHSQEMQELRNFLYETRTFQARFIAVRLEHTLEKMSVGLSKENKELLSHNFFRVASTSNGLYALSDYLNFKGEGISSTEQYQGEGWGLKQVLLRMDPEAAPIPAFIKAAKELLTLRVEHAPKERNEARWLRGWIKRIETYL